MRDSFFILNILKMITVRKANYEERSLIADFQQKMALETESITLDEHAVKEGVKAVFNDSTKGIYYVALNSETVVGSLLTTFEWSDWRNRYVLWIQSVYVLPEYRQHGVFKIMFQHVEQIVNQSDTLSGIRLYVDINNEKAKNVYSKVGMNGDYYQLFEKMKQN